MFQKYFKLSAGLNMSELCSLVWKQDYVVILNGHISNFEALSLCTGLVFAASTYVNVCDECDFECPHIFLNSFSFP